MKTNYSIATVGSIVLLMFALSGCGGSSGPRRAAVEGKVTLNDSPLPSGVIRFVPTGSTKGPVVLGVIKEGHFALAKSQGPVLGQQIVQIDATPAKDPVADAVDVEAAWLEFAKSNKSQPQEIAIPKRYNRNSTLKVGVAAEAANTYDFQLVSK